MLLSYENNLIYITPDDEDESFRKLLGDNVTSEDYSFVQFFSSEGELNFLQAEGTSFILRFCLHSIRF